MWRASVVACALVVGFFGVAGADEGEEAKAHYRKGLSAYALGRYSDAAMEYEKAFELVPDAALLYNAAQAHRMGGNKQRALKLYESYLGLFGAKAPNKDEVKNQIVLLKKAIEQDEKIATSAPTNPAPVHVQTSTTPISAPPEKTAMVTPPPARSSPAVPSPTATTESAPMVEPTNAVAPVSVVAASHTGPEKKPLVKQGWFWGVLAGAVVVVGVAVGAGVALGGPEQAPAANFGSVMGP